MKMKSDTRDPLSGLGGGSPEALENPQNEGGDIWRGEEPEKTRKIGFLGGFLGGQNRGSKNPKKHDFLTFLDPREEVVLGGAQTHTPP